MKTLLILLFLSPLAHPGEITLGSPCSKESLTYKLTGNFKHIGDATLYMLNFFKIPYQGSPSGLKSIYHTPTGLDAVEVISDEEMMSYGWCYTVNHKQPQVYPHEVPYKETDSIIWFYAYAHYYRGEWLSMCNPSIERKSESFCQNLLSR